MSVVQPPERQRCVQGCLLISAFKLQPLQSQRDQIIDATQQNPFHYNILPRGLSDSPMILNHSSSMFSENALTYWKLGEYTVIGDQSDIDATLCTIIQKQNCWNDFIDIFSSRLTSSPNTNSTVSLNLRTTNFLSWNIVLPADETRNRICLLAYKYQN